ncbi:hypothetical protein Terro_3329 [Terriglobus roseus DSM 18391]|uniref:Cupin domain-containing protein n=1 Tax=Terriglobus roseus (strain DSM 18391 / NRRL B-41598 / KBS 63) TaxID=926566 RepID=I3ZJX8_TERRK|nr:hypothetical protein [Terriglobus roseus]AFL89546.1 hypothetical protein Terro_3329 [Terriglobus roseus DSM 18391]
MKIAVAVMALAFASPMLAQTVPPSEMLDSATLRSTADTLLQQAKMSKDGIAFKILLTRPDGNEQVAARVKSGQGEWHRDFADVLIVLEGDAQIVTGGEVVNGKETAPGEIRGDSVKGGKVQPFRTGDAIRIEPQVAHQVLLAPGHTVRYMAVKVKTSK